MQIISSVAGSARAATENQWESFDYGRGPCPGTRRAPKAGVQLLEGTGWPHQGINVTICVFGLRPNTCQKTIMTSRAEYQRYDLLCALRTNTPCQKTTKP